VPLPIGVFLTKTEGFNGHFRLIACDDYWFFGIRVPSDITLIPPPGRHEPGAAIDPLVVLGAITERNSSASVEGDQITALPPRFLSLAILVGNRNLSA